MTFASNIEAEAGEPIEAVIIGPFGWGSMYDEDRIPADKRGVLLTWDEARPLLDYEYDDGLGAADCHAIHAWTASNVLWVHECEGSTSIESIHRNPTDVVPEMR